MAPIIWSVWSLRIRQPPTYLNSPRKARSEWIQKYKAGCSDLALRRAHRFAVKEHKHKLPWLTMYHICIYILFLLYILYICFGIFILYIIRFC